LVPIFNYAVLKAPGREYTRLRFGVGVNVSLDRGFFWLGAQGLFDEDGRDGFVPNQGRGIFLAGGPSASETIRGGLVNFGIERNIWWDWLVLRVGGQKEITYRDVQSEGAGPSYNYIFTNSTADGTAGDVVGFGVGINVEEKLKVDATLAEDMLYTFGNLFSGPQHHVVEDIRHLFLLTPVSGG
jgi:hypothetical protein